MTKRHDFSCWGLAAATTLILALGPGYMRGQTHPLAIPAAFSRPAHGSAMHVQSETPREGWLSPEAQGQHLVYVAYAGDTSFVNIYAAAGQSQKAVGTITNGISGPQGLAVDAGGKLYVANNGNNTVTVYPPGQINPSATYTNAVASPAGLTVGTDGTLYVANIAGAPDGSGSVSVYPPGHMNPSETLTLSGWFALGTAVDSANNLYVLWFELSTFSIRVYKYAPGSTKGTDLRLEVPTGVLPALQLAFDGAGNLVLSFELGTGQLRELVVSFSPGSRKPSRVINLGSLGNGATGFAFSQNFDFLYITLPNANVWMRLTYPKNANTTVLPRDVVHLQGTGLALSPGT